MPYRASGSGGDDRRRPTLVPGKLAGGDAWYVQVLFPDGRIDQVGVFCDRFETRDWIARKSAAWLADYEQRRMNDRWDRVRLRVNFASSIRPLLRSGERGATH